MTTDTPAVCAARRALLAAELEAFKASRGSVNGYRGPHTRHKVGAGVRGKGRGPRRAHRFKLPKWLGDLPDPLIPALGLAPEAT